MNLRTTLASAIGAVALAAAAAYAPAASADRIGFNVTFGGPGYAFNVGNAGYGHYNYYRPAPVVVAPYAPSYYAPYYRPYRPYYAPVVVRPHQAHRPYRGHRNDWRRHDRPVGYVSYDRYYR